MTDDIVRVSIPDLVGAVYGVRGWSLAADGTLKNWQPGKNIAVCRSDRIHSPPVVGCGCGYYGYYGVGRFDVQGDYGEVRGLIKGWGRVAVARDGWRAQYAEVVAIVQGSRHADAIAQRYGVPTMSQDEIDLLARNNTVPVNMRPHRMAAAVEKPVAPGRPLFRSASPPPTHTTHSKAAWEMWLAIAAACTIGALLVAIGLGASVVLTVPATLFLGVLVALAGMIR